MVDPIQPGEAPLILTVDENGIGERHHRAIRDFLGNETFRPRKTENE
jgi:hypothetical protein